MTDIIKTLCFPTGQTFATMPCGRRTNVVSIRCRDGRTFMTVSMPNYTSATTFLNAFNCVDWSSRSGQSWTVKVRRSGHLVATKA